MKQRALTVAAALVTVAAALIWALQGTGPVASPSPVGGTESLASVPTSPSPLSGADADAEAGDDPSTEELVSYAIATAELQGLPPDLPPGSTVDLWVTWQPPVTKRAKVRPLLEGVRLEKIAPPLLPDGPQAAILAVPAERISDLIWGDRFGALTVVVPPDPAA